MSIPYNKVTAVIELANIVHNFHLLNAVSGGVVPVIKADAYGHGLTQVAQVLSAEGAETFAVGTVEEAVALRASGHARRVIALLGPVDRSECKALWSSGVIAFLHCFEQLDMLAEVEADMDEAVSVALKFDTGMARLGFTSGDIPELLETLAASPGLAVEMAASHLATADEPGARDFVLEQGRVFAGILGSLRAAGHRVAGCLANSAALLAYPELHHDVQRPGIALYGANPFHGTPLASAGAGLLPGMEAAAPILQVHDLPAGRSISYGRTFTAPRDMRVAVVAVGYADNYSRGLANKGYMNLAGTRVPILGRVCMQMTAVDVTGLQCQAGDEVFLLGGPGDTVTAEDLAAWWGTITYEVFCLLGQNPRAEVLDTVG